MYCIFGLFPSQQQNAHKLLFCFSNTVFCRTKDAGAVSLKCQRTNQEEVQKNKVTIEPKPVIFSFVMYTYLYVTTIGSI